MSYPRKKPAGASLFGFLLSPPSVLILFMLSAALTCSVDVRQVPEGTKPYSAPSLCQVPVFLGDVHVFSHHSRYDSLAWKAHLQDSLKRYRLFSEIHDLEGSTLPREYLILDVRIRPDFEDEYDWWWAWPAVYPMVGYWPIQPRSGKYTIKIEYKIKDGKYSETVSRSISHSGEEEVQFYGFYRTSSLERMIHLANQEATYKLLSSMESTLESIEGCRPDSSNDSEEGTTRDSNEREKESRTDANNGEGAATDTRGEQDGETAD